MDFEQAVERLRAFGRGRFQLRDYFSAARAPYRLVNLGVECGDDYQETLLALAAIAVETGGHLIFWTHYSPVAIEISLARDLRPDEIPEDPPTESREVSL